VKRLGNGGIGSLLTSFCLLTYDKHTFIQTNTCTTNTHQFKLMRVAVAKGLPGAESVLDDGKEEVGGPRGRGRRGRGEGGIRPHYQGISFFLLSSYHWRLSLVISSVLVTH